MLAQFEVAVNLGDALSEFVLKTHALLLDLLLGFSANERVLLLVEEGGFPSERRLLGETTHTRVLLGLGVFDQLLKVVVHGVVVADLAGHRVAVVNLVGLVAVHLPGLGHLLF